MPSFNTAVRGQARPRPQSVPDGEGNIFGKGTMNPMFGNGSTMSPNENFMRRMANQNALKLMPQYGPASAAGKPDASEPPAPPTGATQIQGKGGTDPGKGGQPGFGNFKAAPAKSFAPDWQQGKPDSGASAMQEPSYQEMNSIGDLDPGVNGNMMDEMSLAPAAPPTDMERMAKSAGGPDESYAAMRNMAQSAELGQPAHKQNRFLGALKAIGRGVKKLGGTPNSIRRQSEVMY